MSRSVADIKKELAEEEARVKQLTAQAYNSYLRKWYDTTLSVADREAERKKYEEMVKGLKVNSKIAALQKELEEATTASQKAGAGADSLYNEQLTTDNNARGSAQTQPRQLSQQIIDQTPYGNANANLLNRDAAQNANMQDRATTLARSRQVDALNNRVFFNPAVVGAGAEALGGAGYQQGYGRYQMPQIETEDSRAQARQRQYEQNVVNADINRQDDTRRLGLEWLQRYNQDAFNRSMAEFAANLGLNVQSTQFNNIMRVARSDPNLANFLTSLYAPGSTPPDVMSQISGRTIQGMFDQALRNNGGDYEAAAREVYPKLMQLMSSIGVGSIGGMASGIYGASQEEIEAFQNWRKNNKPAAVKGREE